MAWHTVGAVETLAELRGTGRLVAGAFSSQRELLSAELIGSGRKCPILLTKCLARTKSVAISKKGLLHLITHFIDSELNLLFPKLNEKSKHEQETLRFPLQAIEGCVPSSGRGPTCLLAPPHVRNSGLRRHGHLDVHPCLCHRVSQLPPGALASCKDRDELRVQS